MAYSTPKTDWTITISGGIYVGDFLNASDYTRICDNITYLALVINSQYGKSIVLNPMTSMTVNSIPYASDFNAIEDNIELLCQNLTIPSTWTGKKTWYANKPTPTVGDWNRWEGTILELKKRIDYDAMWVGFTTADNEPFTDVNGNYFNVLGA